MNPRSRTLLLILLSILVFGPLTFAQVEIQKEETEKDLWTDAMYYLKIGRMEYGKAYLQAYLDRKVDPVKTLEFSEQDPRSVEILIKLQTDPALGSLARAALDQIDKGWQIRRRDIPRIQGEIDRLTGTPRAQFQATERLKEAGEYAVPVMLEYLADANRPAMHAKIIDALVALGPSAVEPLVAAVTDLPEPSKLLVLRAIGRLDYSQSIPYLKEIIENRTVNATVRAAATRALESILSRNPKYRTDANAARSFYQLALRYYYRDSAVAPAIGLDNTKAAGLASDIAADQPNVWFFRDGKLIPQPVPWEIYYELMTMRLTRRSLGLESTGGYRAALTLWLMANCKRESKLSAQVVDPIHAKDFPDAQYFFRCAGTRYGLEALATALKDGDNVIAIAALEALREVASGNDILATACESQPMVNALTHRNQLVQTYAALALGWAAPGDKYPSMETVVPLLGHVLMGTQSPIAVLIIPDAPKRTAAAALAKGMGYNVKEAGDYAAGMKTLTENPADVELIVLDYNLATPSVDQVLNRIRENTFLRRVPVLVVTSQAQISDAAAVVGRMPGVSVVAEGAAADVLANQVDYLRRQLGRVVLDKEIVARNSLLAAAALERLARLKLPQYNVDVAGKNLTETLNSADWPLAVVAGKVLSLLPSPAAQRTLADAALARKDVDQKICLLNFLTDSVRSYCNKLTAQQVAQLQDLAIKETNPGIRHATANVLGALNLEPQVAKNVLLARDPFGAAK